MKRRSFLYKTGILVAGGAAAAGSATKDAERENVPRHGADGAGEVLITSAGSDLCAAIAERLSESSPVRVTAPAKTRTRFPFVKSDLGHEASTDELLKGVREVVHVALPPPGTCGTGLIDFRTRCTYNMLRAAARHGVRKVLYLSSLGIMLGYDQRFMITEDYRPRPTPDAETLSHYLGEFTCREFARSGELDLVVLRLGRLDHPEADSPPTDEFPLTRLRDVAAAVALALAGGKGGDGPGLGPWNVVHIHSEAQSSRFPLSKAARLLQYSPKSTEGGP